MNMIREYAVIVNGYRGKGNECVYVTKDVTKAIEEMAFHSKWNELEGRGKCWIESRVCSEWEEYDVEKELSNNG